MADKPTTAAGYRSEDVELVRATCLYVATKLGDLMEDLIVVGGLVPSLLVDQTRLSPGVDPHVGTMDLDVGMTLAVLDDGRYRTLTEALRRADFAPDKNAKGKPTRQRWRSTTAKAVTIDFLIPPTGPKDRGGKIKSLESDFAAIIAPGLHLAFVDREPVRLVGQTILGEKADRTVMVCGVGAYVVLKAHAFAICGENKDAYDLYHLVRSYGTDIENVAERLTPLLTDDVAKKALEILQRDFIDVDALGPRRAAHFMSGGADANIQADVAGTIAALLRRCGSS